MHEGILCEFAKPTVNSVAGVDHEIVTVVFPSKRGFPSANDESREANCMAT